MTRPTRYRTPRQQAIVALFRTTDSVRRAFARLLEAYGLTVQQYNVLRILRGARPDALPTMEIAERMMEQTPGITRLLDRLEEKGLVRRARDGEDRRQVLCTISRSGVRLIGQVDEPMDVLDEELLGMLEEREVKQLIALLDRVREEGA